MSDLAFLVAESFLMIVGGFAIVLFSRLARDVGDQIATGVVRGRRVPPRVRQDMLFNLWLPWQASPVGVAAFCAVVQVEMANHVGSPGVRLVAYLAAFLAACGSGFALMSAAFAFFGFRGKIRRDT